MTRVTVKLGTFVVTAVLILLPAGAFAQQAPAEPADASGGIVHTVIAGDTLWDLSAKYLGTPWKWTEIWERNRFITNPHYIYPGIQVVIVPPGPREIALGQEAAPPSGPAEPAPPPAGATGGSPYARLLLLPELSAVGSFAAAWNDYDVELLSPRSGPYSAHEGEPQFLFEEVERRPPERLVVRVADPDLPFGGRWTYTLAPDGEGTLLSIREDGVVRNPLFRLVSRYVLGHTATLDATLRAVRERLARPGAPSEG